MKLTKEEQEWLDAYRQALREEFPNVVESVLVYGSKARGDDRPDSDLDILVLIREGDSRLKRAVRHAGHRLAVFSDVVPSIMVYTRAEWDLRREHDNPFYRAVMRDGVQIG